MGNESRSAIFALIGQAIASNDEPAVALRTALGAMATYCGATIDLWVIGDGDGSLRRLTGSTEGCEVAESERARAARVEAFNRSSARVGQPSDTSPGFLAVPLVARGRVQGVLMAGAVAQPEALVAAEALLVEVAPLLGLFVQSLAVESDRTRTLDQSGAVTSSAREDLLEALRLELARARRARSGCAVLLSGVDRIDDLTAELGPAAGDIAIEAFADLLKQTCRDTDVIGRLDDGRFAIVLAGSDSRGAQIAADRLLGQLHARAAVIAPVPRPLSASIGIAVFPVDGFSADELLENASVALSEARRLGGNQVAAA